ncbi:MAG: acetyl-CoA decarbonylase/synthase complex subunit gamma [Chloroflexi bacterium]|nr:acetyl-CoA decarbonylase/synthase complex subunit gamma [Chloroflexota bacterium]MBM3175700.1 acetyl-CoA decarbonylase/synthase complex subunit gamma [Chloroflexota bacterium]
MALKGTDVVKRLPDGGKKNCRECGFPTCFAFAMKLAAGGVSLDKCPYLPADVKAELEEALAPPIKPVTIGSGKNAFTIGGEEVVYRHEKTFVHQPGIALLISDKEAEAKVNEKLKKIAELQFPWVGLTLKANVLALRFESGDKAKFEALVKKVCEGIDLPIVLMSEDVDVLLSACKICGNKKPLLYPVTKDNIDKVITGIKSSPTPVVVRGHSVEELIPLTTKLKEAGLDEIVLDLVAKNMQEAIRDQTLIRRAALKQNFRPLGYPTIGFPCFIAKDEVREILLAAMFVIKYPGIIVLSDFDQYSLLPLLVQRLNIYTDPRIPMSVEQKVYEIGEPNDESPVLITSNWALTYFIVASEVEGSKIPSWLCVKDTEGLGVLTGWAAGKFSGDSIGPFIKKTGIEDKIKHKKLVIPGKVARIKGELEEALPGWEIIVGPREASEIPAYLPGLVKKWKN